MGEVIFRTTLVFAELEQWATRKNISLFPVKSEKGYTIDLYINGQFIKSGNKIYDTWQEAKAYTLDALYKRLG